MKKFIKIILVLCFGFIACIKYETNRNNPFDPRSKNSLYYLQLLSGSGISGLIGTSTGISIGTGVGTSTGTGAGVATGTSTGTGSSGKPDLVVSSCTVPSSTYTSGETGILRGATISIPCTITNQGGASTGSNGIYNGVYLSTNSTVDTSDTHLFYDFYSSNIGQGQSASITLTGSISTSQSTGSYYIGFATDCYKAGCASGIVESNETNNWSPSYLINLVNEKPDLVITSITTPNTVTRNVNFNVTVTIKNQGNSASGSNGIYNGVYLSTNSTVDTSDTHLFYDFYSNNIDPGQSVSITLTGYVSSGQSIGSYYIGVATDCYKAGCASGVVESNETNNWSTVKAITVN